jgi:hypothetical protein
MLKCLGLPLVLWISLIVSLPHANTASGHKPPVNSPTPLSPSIDEPSLGCYMVTSEGRTVDLTHLCGGTRDNQPTRASERMNRTNPNSGSNVAGDLGTEGCYIFDANGRPCPSGQ